MTGNSPSVQKIQYHVLGYLGDPTSATGKTVALEDVNNNALRDAGERIVVLGHGGVGVPEREASSEEKRRYAPLPVLRIQHEPERIVSDEAWETPPQGVLPKDFDPVKALSNDRGLFDPLRYFETHPNGQVLSRVYVYNCGKAIAERCSRPQVPRKLQVENIAQDCQSPVDKNLAEGRVLGSLFREIGLEGAVREFFQLNLSQFGDFSVERAGKLGHAVGSYLFNVKGHAWYCPVDNDDAPKHPFLPHPLQLWDMKWDGLRGWKHNAQINYVSVPGWVLFGLPTFIPQFESVEYRLLAAALAVRVVEISLQGQTLPVLGGLLSLGGRASMLPLSLVPSSLFEQTPEAQ